MGFQRVRSEAPGECPPNLLASAWGQLAYLLVSSPEPDDWEQAAAVS